MIHPRSLKRHAPYFDFPKMHQACRAIEQKYGLAVDEGMEPGCPKKDGLASAKVKRIEAQTGQESLFSYILRHKPEIMAAVDQAANWPAVHEGFLKYGLILKPSGNGLTIKDRFGKHYAKPSQIDRSLSKGKLCERLGAFEEAVPNLFNSVKPIETYTALPLHQGPERDNLYAMFQDEMKRRQEALDEIKGESARRYADIKERWKLKRQEIKRLPMMKIDRQRLELSIKKREQDELGQMRAQMADARNKVRADIPYTSWGKCLQHKAALGDETALAILRSKKEVVQPEKQQSFIAPSAPKAAINWLEKQREILEAPGISVRHRQSLLAIVKMRELMERDTPSGQAVPNFTYSIDTKGTVIFKLASGGTIRDTGKEIHFSNSNQNAKTLAEKYAKVKWGSLTDITNANVIKTRKYSKRKNFSKER